MHIDFIKTLPQYLLPKRALTLFAGLMANCRVKWIKNFLISDFIARYGVNMQLAQEENPKAYACFNDFFIRQLKSKHRPIASVDIISPVDGVVSQFGSIQQGQFIQAKGRSYGVEELLACDAGLAKLFYAGQFATFYLSPKDYHRIHMPLQGDVREMVHVPGKLFSVQPMTARAIPKLFAQNERLVVFFDTDVGLMAMVLVGAVVVGSIATTWHGDLYRSHVTMTYQYDDLTQTITLQKGDEMGHFKLGSTVILLFAEGKRIHWQSDLRLGQSISFGEGIASIQRV